MRSRKRIVLRKFSPAKRDPDSLVRAGPKGDPSRLVFSSLQWYPFERSSHVRFCDPSVGGFFGNPRTGLTIGMPIVSGVRVSDRYVLGDDSSGNAGGGNGGIIRTDMATLILDIETVGEDFDALDETTREVMTRWIRRESPHEGEYQAALKDLKEGLGFSPLTGEVVAIGILDAEREKGAVYFRVPGGEGEVIEENRFKYEPLSEADMLRKFWEVAEKYDTFVTFNGRSFDMPFIMIRSAIHGVRPTKNLVANRYLNYQPGNAKHIDLLEQFSFYGALRRKGSLHLWTRAFGIESPKAAGISGDDVGVLFAAGRYEDIARYNARDLDATLALYRKYREFLAF